MFEIYLQFFISFEASGHMASDSSPVVVLRCLTPNDLLPINRNIVLPQVGRTIVKNGMHAFVMNLWHSFFSFNSCADSMDQAKTRLDAPLSRAWNRVICKSFKHYFPELLGTLQAGDYRKVKAYSKWLRSNDAMLSNGAMNQNMHTFREHIRNTSIIQETQYSDDFSCSPTTNSPFPFGCGNVQSTTNTSSPFIYDCDNLGTATSAYPFEKAPHFNLGNIMNSIEDTNTLSNTSFDNPDDDSVRCYKRHKH